MVIAASVRRASTIVPLGAMTYYFDGIDELLRESFTRFATTVSDRFREGLAGQAAPHARFVRLDRAPTRENDADVATFAQAVGSRSAPPAPHLLRNDPRRSDPRDGQTAMARSRSAGVVWRYSHVGLHDGGERDSGVASRSPIADDERADARSGRSLGGALAAEVRSRIDYDFSHVRLHSDEEESQPSSSRTARASTQGSDIFFRTGLRSPAESDPRLLAHELAHVAQFDAARREPTRPPSTVESLEAEARFIADCFVRGDPVPEVEGVARGLAAPLRQSDDPPGVPTFGNLPQDQPLPTGARRVELVLDPRTGKWIESAPQRSPQRRTARGSYDFVVQNGKIWAVRSGRLGHTEAAQGGRVVWAGTINFDKHGTLSNWTNESGHYLNPGGFERNAVRAHPNLPLERFTATAHGPVVRPDYRKQGPQLPVFPPTEARSTDVAASTQLAESAESPRTAAGEISVPQRGSAQKAGARAAAVTSVAGEINTPGMGPRLNVRSFARGLKATAATVKRGFKGLLPTRGGGRMRINAAGEIGFAILNQQKVDEELGKVDRIVNERLPQALRQGIDLAFRHPDEPLFVNVVYRIVDPVWIGPGDVNLPSWVDFDHVHVFVDTESRPEIRRLKSVQSSYGIVDLKADHGRSYALDDLLSTLGPEWLTAFRRARQAGREEQFRKSPESAPLVYIHEAPREDPIR